MATRTTARPISPARAVVARPRPTVNSNPGGAGVATKVKNRARAKANTRVLTPPTVADRALGLCAIFSLAFVGLCGRLFYLQILRHNALMLEAQETRARAVRLPARRGELLDREGNLLVRNEPAFAIALDPNIWFDTPKGKSGDTPEVQKERVIEELRMALPDIDVAGIIDKRGIQKGKSGRYRTIEIAPIVSEGTGQMIDKMNLPGVSVQPTARRVALDGELATHVLGFTRRDGVGAAGVEYALDAALTGAPGLMDAEFDPGGRVIPGTVRKERPALNGQDVILTLDSDLQHITQQALGKAFAKAKAASGAAVVLDPSNGDILALASYPSYNVNDRSDVRKEAWINYAASTPFEPGSTLKTITVAAALEEHKVGADSYFFCSGERQIGNKRIHCHGGEKHGNINLTGVIKNSCNIATAECAFEVGRTRLYDYLRRFGFGVKTGSGLPGESPGMLARPDRWSDIQLSNIAFGQGISVTALQLVAAYGAVANDGVWVRPRIIRGVRDDAGTVKEFTPEGSRRVLSAATARSLRPMLKAVIDEGTGTAARLNGYTAGGKTGTAQLAEKGRYRGKHIASFIGLAPVDKPRYVILVVITDPKGEYYGGAVSGPVFKEIAEAALTKARMPRDPNAVRMPNAKVTSRD